MSGLDYAAFWAFGEWADYKALFDRLEIEQAKAREQQHERFVTIGETEFSLLPHSGGPWGKYRRQFQLMAGGMYFGLIKAGTDGRPQMKVEVKGATLTQLGEKRVLQFIKAAFKSLGFKYERSQMQRVDIRCDFTSFCPGEVFQLWYGENRVVTKAGKIFPIFSASGDCETFQVGKAHQSNISCRIYDKLAEVEGNPRKMNLVYECILEGEEVDQLTRVEFELSRKAMKERYKCESFEDVLARLVPICDDLTGNWLRVYADEVDRSHTSRLKGDESKLHPIWLEVRSAFLEFASTFKQRKVKEYRAKPQSTEQQKNATLGYIAKIAATENKNVAGWSVHQLVMFVAGLFHDMGHSMSDFTARVRKEKQKQAKRRLDDLFAFFDNQTVKQQPLLFDSGSGVPTLA